VGTNPTFGVEPLHVEAFLIDFPAVELRVHEAFQDEEAVVIQPSTFAFSQHGCIG